MEILTAMVTVFALALFLVGAFKRNQSVRYVAILTTLIALVAALVDSGLSSNELLVLVIFDAMLFLMSMAWALLPSERGRRGRA